MSSEDIENKNHWETEPEEELHESDFDATERRLAGLQPATKAVEETYLQAIASPEITAHVKEIPKDSNVIYVNPLDKNPIPIEHPIQYTTDSPPRQCALCGKFNITGILRVCSECWSELTTVPKVHLRLEDSAKHKQGVVMWDHNSIGAEPHDKEPIAVGIWGMYGQEGGGQTYWVSLCKPIDAIHDMMTQFNLHLREENEKLLATYSYSRTPGSDSSSTFRNRTVGDQIKTSRRFSTREREIVEKPIEPVVDNSAAFKSLRDRLGK